MVVAHPAGAGARRVGDLGALTTAHRVGLWLTGAWTGAGVVLWLAFPMLAPVLMPLSAIVPLAWCWAVERRLPWFLPSPASLTLMLATGYLLATAGWSPSRQLAVELAVFLTLMLGVVHVVPHTLPRLDRRVLLALAIGGLVGLTIGGLFVAVEVFSGQLIRRALMSYLPLLRPDPHELWGPDSLASYLINKHVCVLTLLLCPAALIARRLRLRDRHRLALIAALAFVSITIFSSPHDSSKMALLAGLAIFALFRLRPAAARRLVLTGWIVVNLCVVPASLLLYSAGLHHATWLPESWRHRIVIWGYTAEQVKSAPVFGAGVEAARAAYSQGQSVRVPVPDTNFTLSTNWHSHNGYLQIWYDAGALGALICLAFGLLVLRGVGQALPEAQPYLLAQFTAAAAMAASSYGIWAYWFIASLAMSSAFAALAAAVPAAPARAAWRWKPTAAALAAAAAATAAVGATLQSLAPLHRVTLDPSFIAAQEGAAYRITVTAFGGLLQPVATSAASHERRSRPVLTEDGTAIGPADALHKDISEQGMGRYALRGAHLYFSASDNTDPRSNGRQYVVVVPMGLGQGAVWSVSLLSGFLLLSFWPSVAGRLRRLATGAASVRPGTAALVVAAGAGVVLAASLQAIVVSAHVVLDADAIVRDRGFAYTAKIAPATGLLRLATSSGQGGSPSPAPSLLENGARIGRAGALHQDIRDQGLGRYALSGSYLYFSTSDNTDPRRNGRQYVAVVPMALSRGAAWSAGVLGAVILLAGWGAIAARAARAASGLLCARPSIRALVVSAMAGMAVAIGLQACVASVPVVLDSDAIAADRGFAYTIEIAAPAGLLRLAPRVEAPAGAGFADGLTENGIKLGPTGALHRDIRDRGSGRYALSGAYLYFSATDNSDPRSNGRRYVVVVPMTPSPSAAAVAGLFAGVLLLVGWPSLAAWASAAASAAGACLRQGASALRSLGVSCGAVTTAAVARHRPSAAALAVAATFSSAMALTLQGLFVAQAIVITPASLAPEQGFAFTAQLASPSALLRLGLGDGQIGPRGAALALSEDSARLGLGGALHQDIRAKGMGRYAVSGTDLYLSATDNSDPRTNGRRYVAVVPVALSPTAAWCSALIAGLVLLAGWPTLAPRLAAWAASLGAAGIVRLRLGAASIATLAPSGWSSLRARISPVTAACTRPSIGSVIVSTAGGIAVATGLQAAVAFHAMGLAPAAMVPEQGYAYTVALASPHPRLLRLGLGEPQAGARGAALTLIEDGRTLGPAGALHHDIRDQGGGRYALSGAELYFAASDNTDPRSNGRRYSVMVPMALTREAAWAAGLLSGLLLLVCWPTLATLATLASWATARTTAAWTTTVASASRAASVAASLAAAAMARFRPSLAAVAVSAAAGIGVAVGLPMVVVPHPLVIAPASILPERGYAYTFEIAPPSSLLRLDLSEQAAGPRGAFLTLLENGAKLGPVGALHQDIRDQGAGRYALSHTHLYLSATDNSDPRSNGRRYALVVPMAPSPVAGCVAGLLGAVVLLVSSALMRSRRRFERRA